MPPQHTAQRNARMLMVVLPGSLALTWLWKQTSVASGSLALSHAPRWPPADDPDPSLRQRVVRYYTEPASPDARECEALRTVGHSLHLTTPHDLHRWDADPNCCAWAGVQESWTHSLRLIQTEYTNRIYKPNIHLRVSYPTLVASVSNRMCPHVQYRTVHFISVPFRLMSSYTPDCAFFASVACQV